MGLEHFGVSAFVAHEDIRPTTEWQEKILEALDTMQAFVALLTDGFRDSQWTDQEIGYALCREVPIIPVRLGTDPYGFIGKIQALSCEWITLPFEIVRLLIGEDESMTDAFIDAVQNCESYSDANALGVLLGDIDSLTDSQGTRLVNAYNSNRQVSESYGFNGSRPSTYGLGLVEHLNRATEGTYYLQGEQIIEDDLPW